jgi:hypothetical protein
VEAREQFRICGRQQCPGMVQQDCGTWLGEVEKSLPTVVLSAKSPGGADLVDVQVSVDGQPLATKLDGQAVPTNPGPHLFHFALRDGTQLDQQVLVKEGEKNRAVVAVLGKPAEASSPPTPPPPAPEQPAAPEAPKPVAESPVATGKAPSTLKTLGWVAGGLGVVGLGVGTVAGILAIGDKGGAHCVQNVCDPGSLSGLKTAAAISDVGLIAGGVLLAGGAALILFAPSGPRGGSESGVSVRVAPSWVQNGGGVVVGGRF